MTTPNRSRTPDKSESANATAFWMQQEGKTPQKVPVHEKVVERPFHAEPSAAADATAFWVSQQKKQGGSRDSSRDGRSKSTADRDKDNDRALDTALKAFQKKTKDKHSSRPTKESDDESESQSSEEEQRHSRKHREEKHKRRNSKADEEEEEEEVSRKSKKHRKSKRTKDSDLDEDDENVNEEEDADGKKKKKVKAPKAFFTTRFNTWYLRFFLAATFCGIGAQKITGIPPQVSEMQHEMWFRHYGALGFDTYMARVMIGVLELLCGLGIFTGIYKWAESEFSYNIEWMCTQMLSCTMFVACFCHWSMDPIEGSGPLKGTTNVLLPALMSMPALGLLALLQSISPIFNFSFFVYSDGRKKKSKHHRRHSSSRRY